MKLRWNEKYSVSIPLLDDQHKNLFKLIKNLQSALNGSSQRKAHMELLIGLVEYTVTHFRAEEELMKKHGFPGYEEHLNAHKDLVGQVNHLCDRFRSDAPPLQMN